MASTEIRPAASGVAAPCEVPWQRELQALRVLEDALRLQLDPDGGATP
eukprot:SAG25_NODE_3407_length_1093_cov_2.547284_1_plen_47_part_10